MRRREDVEVAFYTLSYQVGPKIMIYEKILFPQ